MHRHWRGLLAAQSKGLLLPVFTPPPLGRIRAPAIACGLAWRAQRRRVAIADGVERVAAELICPYLPGILLLVPGEKLDETWLDWLLEQKYLWPEQIAGTVKALAL